MILPNKYISNSESLMGINALILDVISCNTLPIEDLWNKFSKKYIDSKKIKSPMSYHKFILAINLMYITGMINYNMEGGIFNENIRIDN